MKIPAKAGILLYERREMLIDIKPAQISDISFILESVYVINRKSGITYKPYLNETTLEQDVFGTNPAAFVIIAFSEKNPVGMIMYTPMYATALGRYMWAIQIFTHPDCRRQGIARKMLNYIQENNPQANAVCWAATEENKEARIAFPRITSNIMQNANFYILKPELK